MATAIMTLLVFNSFRMVLVDTACAETAPHNISRNNQSPFDVALGCFVACEMPSA
jgi:hypothetical protein